MHTLAYFISGVMISAAKLSEGSCVPRGINPGLGKVKKFSKQTT